MRPFEEKRVRFAPAEASGEHPREASLGRANPGKRGKPEATPRRVKAERKTGDSKENQDENTTTGENQQRQKKRKTRVEKKMYGAQIFSKFINTGSKHNRTETCINLHVSHRLMSTAPAIAKPPPPASCEHGSREGSRDFSSVWTPLPIRALVQSMAIRFVDKAPLRFVFPHCHETGWAGFKSTAHAVETRSTIPAPGPGAAT